MGRGSFARVTEVENDSGVRCAKKTFEPMEHLVKAVGKENLERRFKREVKYQSTLSHPNIVPILESNLDDDPPFFLMPLAECTLKDELESDPSVDGRYKEVLFDLLSGLECLHENGFVHRDLKPENILRYPNGKHRYAISDCGLIAATNVDVSTLTGANARGGSLYYAAPELTRDFGAATAQADIYSFGAILHDMFAMGATRTPYSELSLSGPLGKVIGKCTKNNPFRRYNSVSSLRNDLSQALSIDESSFATSDEQQFVEILHENTNLNSNQWDELFVYIQGLDDLKTGVSKIFAVLSLDHIDQLVIDSPELLQALGLYFIDYVHNNTFDFDYCDVLASKIERFHDHGEIALKASMILAMLQLGASHHRWYVERKFLSLSGPDIDDILARRIMVEIEATEVNFVDLMKRLEISFADGRKQLHPILQSYLDGKRT